jgi:hypothetical protein
MNTNDAPDAFLIVAGPTGHERYVADDTGRLVAAFRPDIACRFAHRLATRGTPALVCSRTALEVAAIVADAGADESAIVFIEACATSEDDANAWAIEIADRVPLVREYAL